MAMVVSIGGFIGLVLGLLGGGGSVLMLPALVYVAEIPAREAIGLSLVVVGGTSLVGGLNKWRSGRVHPKAVLLFGVAGALGALIGTRFTSFVSQQLLMLIFALLMGVVGMLMLRGISSPNRSENDPCRVWPCLLIGFTVGILTGFLGVGGGFIVTPALALFAKLPMKTAIGTSLMIISLSSIAGLFGHLSTRAIDWRLAAILIVSSLLGMTAGTGLSARVSTRQLRMGFGWLVLGTAIVVTIHNINF